MAYTDTALLLSGLPSFDNTDNEFTTPMQLSQSDADAIINSALDTLYTVPFADYVVDADPQPCPGIVTTVAGMLSKSIFLSGEFLSNSANAQPRQSMMLWDRAWMLLNKLIAGDLKVVGNSVTPILASNPGIWAVKKKVASVLADFDLESPLYPRLHDRMRGPNMYRLKYIADDGSIQYYSGACCLASN
jgi:hypothetical protein